MNEEQVTFETDEEAMDAVWTRIQSEAPAEPVKPDAKPETQREASQDAKPEETSETRERDEHGRFVAKQPEAEAPETPEKPAEAVKEPENDAPSILPKSVRERWANLDPELRDVLTTQQTRMSQVLAEAGKQKQAIGPIYDKVIEAAKEFPQLAKMSPGEIAGEVFELARWASSLDQDPVASILSLAEQKGVLDGLKQRLGGTEAPEAGGEVAALKQQVASLQGQLQKMMDPSHITNAVTQQITHNNTMTEVQAFAASKPDWAEIEPELADFIPIARRMQPEGSPKAILEAAYEMAKYALPATRTRLLSERETRAAQERARAVNVNSQGSAGPGELTEDQMMDQIWAKHYGG